MLVSLINKPCIIGLHTIKVDVDCLHFSLLKAEGIQIFTIGIGDQIKDSELRNLASSPNFVFLVNNYLRLNSIRDSFALQLCQGDLIFHLRHFTTYV